jgi:hypothetical protein
MLRQGFIGAKHTNIDNIPKGKPKTDYKAIERELRLMQKEGYFWVTPKPDGLHISLNPRLLQKIEHELET